MKALLNLEFSILLTELLLEYRLDGVIPDVVFTLQPLATLQLQLFASQHRRIWVIF